MLQICLFTRGEILLGIESAPSSEDDEDEKVKNGVGAVFVGRAGTITSLIFYEA